MPAAEPPDRSQSTEFGVLGSFVGLLVLTVIAAYLLRKRKQRSRVLHSSAASAKPAISDRPQTVVHLSIAQRLGWTTILALLDGAIFEVATLTFLSLFWRLGLTDIIGLSDGGRRALDNFETEKSGI
ncbi:hypothetical protein F5Y13DRAFT_188605 [Hypoxylon sp. FL1857]|nr:hypothetical protein F5Y13DRAFT_188605 [Hypoxylon sp. FL1857]